MRTVYEERLAEATTIQRQIRQGSDRIVRCQFAVVAKALWPHKTSAHLAAIAETSDRAAARWISGEIEPPGILIAAIVMEITKRK